MPTIPKPKIGNVSVCTITSHDLEKSLQYYQQLGFTELYRSDFPFPWIQISDGALIIMLRKDSTPYISLTYFVKNLEEITSELEQNGISFIQKPNADDMIKRFVFQSPDGHNIALVTYVDGFNQPQGATMLTLPQQDYFKPEKYVNKVCGLFGEYALPVKDIDTSIEFWKKLGFEVMSKFQTPYQWAILSDGLAVVGLHQTNHFSQPTITFFASDMKYKIEVLIQKGLTDFVEESESNIVLSTPEMQKINLFNLGM